MPSTLIVWPAAGIPMKSSCREPVTTHRAATVSPLAMMSRRSSTRSGNIALNSATFCLKPASVGSWSGAGLWSTRPGWQSSSIVAWSAARNACSKRVMISMVSDKARPSLPGSVSQPIGCHNIATYRLRQWPRSRDVPDAGTGRVSYDELVRCRGFTVTLLATTVIAAATACSGSAGQGQGSAASAPPGAAGRSSVPLAVPAGEGGGALSTAHTLTIPTGWTARVWARVPDARMEAWTPEGDLLVSDPGGGKIMELRPDAAGTAAVTTLLAGLTNPQGMAFARLDGKWMLYVAESDQIDQYPWGTGGISGGRRVIAARLPDVDPDGDDVHRAKDVTVAADGTVYFNVGSSSNANPDDRSMSPQRAVIMAVSPGGTGLRVVERGVRNGEGLAVAPDGTVWTAVNERDNIPYPAHQPYAGSSDAFGQVIRAYVNEHPPDEVVPVTPGRDLGWPYCDPDQDGSRPAGSLANVPLTANPVTNPGAARLDC